MAPFASLGLALAALLVLAYNRRWRWTGFAEIRRKKADDEEFQPAKTLWDWLQLLVIPLALAGLAFLLNDSQRNRDQRREDQRAKVQRATAADAAREEALRAFLTQMSGLMLDRGLLRSRPGANVRVVARTVTLTTLRRVNGERRGVVVRFLEEARLLQASDPKFELHHADLRSAQLRRALLGADLARADLRRADLRGAFLLDANLQYADLRRANLREASLGAADLKRADLRRALLHGADLRPVGVAGPYSAAADLRYAKLSEATYDSETQWPPGFDPVAAGARKSP